MRLPKKPSALITVALDDLRKVEHSPKYTVGMGTWHTPHGKKCTVCLAGAVMAKTLKTLPTDYRTPDSFDTRTMLALEGLDSFRTGWMESGLEYCGVKERPRNAHLFLDRDVPQYRKNRQGFHRAMRKMARDLRKAGL